MGRARKKLDDRLYLLDYLTWDDGKRWELINGDVWDMTPAPSETSKDFYEISFFGLSPFSKVNRAKRLTPQPTWSSTRKTSYSPIFWWSATAQADRCLYQGGAGPDRGDSLPLHRAQGPEGKEGALRAVRGREYILVDPANEIVERFTLTDGRYGSPDVFGWNESMRSDPLPGTGTQSLGDF